MKSWKTTAAGIAVAIAAVATAIAAWFDGDPGTTVDLVRLFEAIFAGFVAAGFLAARDNDKTSEESGAQKARQKREHLRLPAVLLCVGMGAAMVGMGGCNTLGLPGAQSRIKIEVNETTHDELGLEETFQTLFEARGDVKEMDQAFNYSVPESGYGFNMGVNQGATGLTSPASMAVAESYAELVRTAPALAEAFMPYLTQPQAPSALHALLGLVGSVVGGPIITPP